MEMYVSNAKELYYAIVDGKVIIPKPGGENVSTLGDVGTRIWELADGSHKVKEIVDIICEEFEADRNTVIKDTIEFITDLSKKHLLRLSRDKQKIKR